PELADVELLALSHGGAMEGGWPEDLLADLAAPGARSRNASFPLRLCQHEIRGTIIFNLACIETNHLAQHFVSLLETILRF
ncbi:MAG: hypothetical protein WCA16_01270, partial [Candidatus Sulfotelmatobacter sp.]